MNTTAYNNEVKKIYGGVLFWEKIVNNVTIEIMGTMTMIATNQHVNLAVKYVATLAMMVGTGLLGYLLLL